MSVLRAQDSCEHPDDRREPLPYQGRAADPDEWECLDCGLWQMKDPDSRPSYTRRKVVMGVDLADGPDQTIDLDEAQIIKILRNIVVPRTSYDSVLAFSPEQLAPTFVNVTLDEDLRRLGVQLRYQPDFQTIVLSMALVDAGERFKPYDHLAAIQQNVTRAIDIARKMSFLGVPRELELTAEVSPDTAEQAVIFLSTFERSHGPADHYWKMGHHVYEALVRRAPSYAWQTSSGFRRPLLFGAPIELDDRMRESVAVVLEFSA